MDPLLLHFQHVSCIHVQRILPTTQFSFLHLSVSVSAQAGHCLGGLCSRGSLSRKPPYGKEWAARILLEGFLVFMDHSLRPNFLASKSLIAMLQFSVTPSTRLQGIVYFALCSL